jgi:ribosomal protein S18 acetylase RimI-like enzyme
MEIVKLDEQNIEDAWLVIKECSDWLLDNELDHWANYYTLERMKEKLKLGSVFCMYEGKTPVATVSLSIESPEYYSPTDLTCFSHVADDKTVFISSLGVRPAYQGKGYAKDLLRYCEKFARENGYRAVGFDVRRKYAKLIEFYIKRGFVEVGDMNDEGESYVLFEKVISS